MTDEDLVKIIQRGNKESFGELIDRYEVKLKRYISELINQDEVLVEDIIEDTFIKAYVNLMGFDCRKKFSSWIYRIAHNQSIDFIKKKKSYRLDDWREETEADKRISIENQEIKQEEEMIIREAVRKLEGKYKEVVWLYYFEDKSYEEIADILETSINNVGVIMMRSKEKLKKLISNN